MGRKVKIGLDTFKLSTDLFTDIRVRKVLKRQGAEAMAVYVRLLCMVYEQGYYMQWNEDEAFAVAESVGVTEEKVAQVVNALLQVGLFDAGMFRDYAVLTSAEVQREYAQATTGRKGKGIIGQYNLINSEEKANSAAPQRAKVVSEENKLAENAISCQEITLSESKRKRKEKEALPPTPPTKEKEKEKEKTTTATAPRVRVCACEGAKPQGSSVVLRLDAALVQMRADHQWLMWIGSRFSLTDEDMMQQLSDFSLDCSMLGRTEHAGLDDAKRHFVFWLRKREMNGTLKKKNEKYGTKREDAYSLRRGADVTAKTSADYSERL